MARLDLAQGAIVLSKGVIGLCAALILVTITRHLTGAGKAPSMQTVRVQQVQESGARWRPGHGYVEKPKLVLNASALPAETTKIYLPSPLHVQRQLVAKHQAKDWWQHTLTLMHSEANIGLGPDLPEGMPLPRLTMEAKVNPETTFVVNLLRLAAVLEAATREDKRFVVTDTIIWKETKKNWECHASNGMRCMLRVDDINARSIKSPSFTPPAWLGSEEHAYANFKRTRMNTHGIRISWLAAQYLEYLFTTTNAVESAVANRTRTPLGAGSQVGLGDGHRGWPHHRPIIGMTIRSQDYGNVCMMSVVKAKCAQIGAPRSRHKPAKVAAKLAAKAAAKVAPGASFSCGKLGNFGKGVAGQVNVGDYISYQGLPQAIQAHVNATCMSIDKMVREARDMKLMYGAQVIYLATDSAELLDDLDASDPDSAMREFEWRVLHQVAPLGPFEEAMQLAFLRKADMMVGEATQIQLPWMLIFGRTGVVPPYKALDRPVLADKCKVTAKGERILSITDFLREVEQDGGLAVDQKAIIARGGTNGPFVPRVAEIVREAHTKTGWMRSTPQGFAEYRSREMFDHRLDPEAAPSPPPPAPGIPDPPRLQVVGSTSNSIGIKWDVPNGHGMEIVTYQVQVQEHGSVVGDLMSIDNSMSITGLAPASEYGISARSRTSNGWGLFGAAIFASTIPDIPAQVPGLVAEPVAAGLAEINWSIPKNNGAPIEEYQLEMQQGDVPIFTEKVQGLTFYKSGLTAGGTYTVKVRARNSVGWGPYSETVRLKIPYT
eukprot:jgi/Mesvir1/5490/Mv15536-RA.1